MGLGFHGAKGGLLTGGMACPCLFVMSTAFPLWKAVFCVERSGCVCCR